MFRICARMCASAHRVVLTEESGIKFLAEVERCLSAAKSGEMAAESASISYWEIVNQQNIAFSAKMKELAQLNALMKETSDEELRALAAEDVSSAESSADELAESLVNAVVPRTEIDILNKCQIEFTSGAGGQEAMLFAGELLEMYRKYAEWRGWKWTPFQVEDVPLGGIRSACISVEGEGSYAALRFEAGVHRVQRIPLTDKSRMHTSTASIAVLPEPEEVSVVVPSDAVKIETMRASGPGGQNVNKRSTAVRLTHKETGIAVHCMDERFQHLNIQIAYKRLAAILMQKKFDSMYEKVSSDRKLQVGSKARAEKIRTYNFKDDRITDHRLHLNMSNIEEMMRGTEHLHFLIERLIEMDKDERLRYIIKNCVLE